MKTYLEKIGQQAIDEAGRHAVEAEVYLLHSRELSIEVIDGQVETLKEAEEIGLGMRVFKGGQVGFAFSSDLSETAVRGIVDDAVRISAFTEADAYNILPEGPLKYPDMEIYDPVINTSQLEDKIELARQVERSARAVDKRITIVERAGYEDGEYTTLVLNTRGVNALGSSNFCGSYIFVVAEDKNEAQTGFSVMGSKHLADLDPNFIGEEAAYRALRSLNARTIPSGHFPCVMEPYVVTRFMGLIAQMVDAEAVQKGRSLLAGKIGEQVASPAVSIVDDATFPNGMGSFPFDGEGVPARKTDVIEKGTLKTFLYDYYNALKAGVDPTGNGQRGSFRSLPGVGTTNFILLPGTEGSEAIIAGVKRGFYITEVMGMHTANPISGDFSVGAAGIMIENGDLTYPVRGVTIAGNLRELLQDVELVGNDLRFYGGKAAPTIRIKNLSISGD
ncbi:TldD/PmbA family protein [Syntrophomonas erecta]